MRIGGSDTGQTGQAGPGASGDDKLQPGHQGGARPDSRGAILDNKPRYGPKTATVGETADRAAAFARSIRAAELKAKGEGESIRSQTETDREAAAGAVQLRIEDVAPALLRSAAAAGEGRTSTPGPEITAVVARIEQAVKAESRAAANGLAAVHLDLGDAVAGLKGLTVAMTPTAIDVTLLRSEGEVSAELIGAAQALADRLQQRFGRRIVRVHDTTGEVAAEAGEGHGLQAISNILGQTAKP
jgi:hypothetical protein